MGSEDYTCSIYFMLSSRIQNYSLREKTVVTTENFLGHIVGSS